MGAQSTLRATGLRRRRRQEASAGEPSLAHLVRNIKADQTARIKPGQWLVEQPSDIHEAANHGSTLIVIYLATLLKTGAPPSTPVTLSAAKR